MRNERVFSSSCYAVGQAQLAQARDRVSKLTELELSAENESDTLKALYKKFDIPPAVIEKDGIKVAEREREYFRGKAMLIEFQVPYIGDGKFFILSPSSSNILGNVEVRDGYIGFTYPSQQESPEQMKGRFESDLQRFEATLQLLTAEANQFNERLLQALQTLVDERKAAFGKKNNFLDGLGYSRV